VEQLSPASVNGQGDGHGDRGRSRDPVFVLCMSRSGSTLLRLILDTHPDLACPPETNIPAVLLAQLNDLHHRLGYPPVSPSGP
jgi:Sulfotransferase family